MRPATSITVEGAFHLVTNRRVQWLVDPDHGNDGGNAIDAFGGSMDLQTVVYKLCAAFGMLLRFINMRAVS